MSKVEFDVPKTVEFLTASGAVYTMTQIEAVEQTPEGGLVLRKTDDNFVHVNVGWEMYDVRESFEEGV